MNFEENHKENKENYPGPGYYEIFQKIIVPTPIMKKQNKYVIKSSELTPKLD